MNSGADLQRFDKAARHKFGFGKPLLVDIHQRDLGIGKRRHQQRVAKKVAQENGGACSDKGDFRHPIPPSGRLALGGAEGQPGDEMFLHQEEHDDRRHRGQDGRRRDKVPVADKLAVQGVQPRRDRL